MDTSSLAVPDPESSDYIAKVSSAQSLYAAVLSGRAATTIKSYAADYRDFAGFLRAGSLADCSQPEDALDALTSFSRESAIFCVLAYVESLRQRKLSSATIARRIAALKSVVRLARALGRIDWTLDAIEAPRVEAYRDTRGPGRDNWRLILDRAKVEASTAIGRRNLAIVRLLHDTGLRRGEVVGLVVADLDLAGSRLAILGKGRTAKEWITLPGPARIAVEAWLADRGRDPGPLFVGMFTGRIDASASALSGEGVRLILSSLAWRAGVTIPVRPHGLRHQAITSALDATGGDVRKVMRFSRHRKPETLMRYDDNRLDLAGDVAGLISED